MARLRLEAGGRDLSANLFGPEDRPPSGAGVLLVHGWESSQRSHLPRAKRVCAETGATCLAFDLSGHGESGGRAGSFTPRDHLADTLAAFDALAAAPAVESGRIGVCGASYGAYLAACLIGCRPVEAQLLRAPALYPDSALDTPAGSRHAGPVADGAATPLRNLAAFAGRVLIVESERDEVIPHEVVEAYLTAARDPSYAVLPGARHAMTDPSWNEAFVELLLGWAGPL